MIGCSKSAPSRFPVLPVILSGALIASLNGFHEEMRGFYSDTERPSINPGLIIRMLIRLTSAPLLSASFGLGSEFGPRAICYLFLRNCAAFVLPLRSLRKGLHGF